MGLLIYPFLSPPSDFMDWSSSKTCNLLTDLCLSWLRTLTSFQKFAAKIIHHSDHGMFHHKSTHWSPIVFDCPQKNQFLPLPELAPPIPFCLYFPIYWSPKFCLLAKDYAAFLISAVSDWKSPFHSVFPLCGLSSWVLKIFSFLTPFIPWSLHILQPCLWVNKSAFLLY